MPDTERHRLILEHCLESYPRLRTNISGRQSKVAIEIDYELFLIAYLTAQMDETSRDKEAAFLEAFARFLRWSDRKVEEFRARADRQRSHDFSDFVFTRYYPELAVVAFKLAYAMSHINGVLHPDEEQFLENIKYHFLEHSHSGDHTEVQQALDSLLSDQGIRAEHTPTPSASVAQQSANPAPPEETLEACLKELHALIGLGPVKSEVEHLIRFLQVQEQREKMGLPAQRLSLHMVFTGNAGTGKTTLARLLARVFRAMGILSSGHLVETDRSGLVGSYVGHTAPKTLEMANKALDGVLFIDEAYSLVRDSEGDFGREAIDTLVKFMEDNRERLVVVVAGYDQEMRDFINANPGLQSRFSTTIHFPDFTPSELFSMLEMRCKENEYELTPAAGEALQQHFQTVVAAKERGFGNGRYVRNLFEDAIKNQAFRLMSEERELTREELVLIVPEDLVETLR